MAVTYTQTDNAPDCADQQACATGTVGSQALGTELIDGGTAGSTEQTASIPSSSTRLVVFMQTSGGVGQTTWDSGTYTVNWNITTAQMDTAITGVWICRINSSCTNQETVASDTSLNINIGGGGTFSTNLSGTEQTANATDDLYCITRIENTNTHSSRSVGITPNQDLATPIATPPISESASIQNSIAAPITASETAPTTSSEFGESTAGDWDSFQSETGVHHEQPTGTDWASADTLEKGYSTTDPSLELYWTFDEDSGTTANDVSGNGRNGTISATIGATGVIGTTSVSFDPVNPDVVTADSYTGITGSTNRTIIFWVNIPSNPTNDDAFLCTYGDTNPGTDGQRFTFRTDFLDGVGLVPRVEVTGGFIKGTTNIADGSWHHLGAVLDGTDVTDVTLYVDGNSETVDSSAAQAINTSTANNVRVGSDHGNDGTRDLEGNVDEFRMLSEAWSGTKMTDDYNTAL